MIFPHIVLVRVVCVWGEWWTSTGGSSLEWLFFLKCPRCLLDSLPPQPSCENVTTAEWLALCLCWMCFPNISRLVSSTQKCGDHHTRSRATSHRLVQMISSKGKALNISLRPMSCVRACDITYSRIRRWSFAWCPLKLYRQSVDKRAARQRIDVFGPSLLCGAKTLLF